MDSCWVRDDAPFVVVVVVDGQSCCGRLMRLARFGSRWVSFLLPCPRACARVSRLSTSAGRRVRERDKGRSPCPLCPRFLTRSAALHVRSRTYVGAARLTCTVCMCGNEHEGATRLSAQVSRAGPFVASSAGRRLGLSMLVGPPLVGRLNQQLVDPPVGRLNQQARLLAETAVLRSASQTCPQRYLN